MTVRPIATLAILAALAACGPRRPADTGPELSEVQRACLVDARRTADTNRRRARESNIDNPTNVLRQNTERQEAEDIAYRDCLRRRGAPMPGGVERVTRPRTFEFTW